MARISSSAAFNAQQFRTLATGVLDAAEGIYQGIAQSEVAAGRAYIDSELDRYALDFEKNLRENTFQNSGDTIDETTYRIGAEQFLQSLQTDLASKYRSPAAVTALQQYAQAKQSALKNSLDSMYRNDWVGRTKTAIVAQADAIASGPGDTFTRKQRIEDLFSYGVTQGWSREEAYNAQVRAYSTLYTADLDDLAVQRAELLKKVESGALTVEKAQDAYFGRLDQSTRLGSLGDAKRAYELTRFADEAVPSAVLGIAKRMLIGKDGFVDSAKFQDARAAIEASGIPEGQKTAVQDSLRSWFVGRNQQDMIIKNSIDAPFLEQLVTLSGEVAVSDTPWVQAADITEKMQRITDGRQQFANPANRAAALGDLGALLTHVRGLQASAATQYAKAVKDAATADEAARKDAYSNLATSMEAQVELALPTAWDLKSSAALRALGNQIQGQIKNGYYGDKESMDRASKMIDDINAGLKAQGVSLLDPKDADTSDKPTPETTAQLHAMVNIWMAEGFSYTEIQKKLYAVNEDKGVKYSFAADPRIAEAVNDVMRKTKTIFENNLNSNQIYSDLVKKIPILIKDKNLQNNARDKFTAALLEGMRGKKLSNDEMRELFNQVVQVPIAKGIGDFYGNVNGAWDPKANARDSTRVQSYDYLGGPMGAADWAEVMKKGKAEAIKADNKTYIDNAGKMLRNKMSVTNPNFTVMPGISDDGTELWFDDGKGKRYYPVQIGTSDELYFIEAGVAEAPTKKGDPVITPTGVVVAADPKKSAAQQRTEYEKTTGQATVSSIIGPEVKGASDNIFPKAFEALTAVDAKAKELGISTEKAIESMAEKGLGADKTELSVQKAIVEIAYMIREKKPENDILNKLSEYNMMFVDLNKIRWKNFFLKAQDPSNWPTALATTAAPTQARGSMLAVNSKE